MTSLAAAACRGMDVEMFFEHRGGSAGLAKAREVCASCPVARACLDEAMRMERKANHFRYGIWGGLTGHERMQLARRVAA